jgi:transposase
MEVFMAEPKRKFTPEFKLEAVRLAATSDKPLAQVARELGILPNLLRNWRRQIEGREGQPPADVFPGHGRLPIQDEELRRLRREVETLRQERDFLKKTAVYFAKESR